MNRIAERTTQTDSFVFCFAMDRSSMLKLGWICLYLLVGLRPASAYDHVHVDRGDQGMVVCESALASRIGRDVLGDGGNAVDASVATAFALAVVWPEAGNIGGGGFMLIRPANGKNPVCIDYRETAPAKIDDAAYSVKKTTYSHKGVGVPGTIRGLALAHSKYGKLPWKRLVTPAAELAERGFSVDRFLARSMNLVLNKSDQHQELHRVYGKPDGKAWRSGDRIQLPDLAKTLHAIAKHGPDEFYTGKTSELILSEMKRGNGLMTREDLVGYEAKFRQVITGTYRGYQVIGAPPASSGGTCVIQALNILENFQLAERGRYNPTTLHLIAEALRRSFATRSRFLGDPAFKTVPDYLTTKEYAKELAASIDLEKATPSSQIDGSTYVAKEGPDTTHFSIVDAEGLAVSNTYTIRHSWGSRIVVAGSGIVMNNLFGGFQWTPRNDASPSRVPGIEPGRRLLSSQSPTMVEKDGKLLLVTGSPGGRTIISTTLGILIGVIDFGMTPEEAVRAPRIHHQWKPDRMDLERIVFEPHSEVQEALRTLGHRVQGRRPQGSAHTIAMDPESNEMIGIADYRRGGRPAGIDSRVIARWDFGEQAGVSLSKAKHQGTYDARWISDSPMCQTNGSDCLRLQHKPEIAPADALIDLRNSGLERESLSIEAKISAAHFISEKNKERFLLGFLHRQSGEHGQAFVTAMMVLKPTENGIELMGEALGKGEPTEPILVCDRRRLKQPIVVRLQINGADRSYSVDYRLASESTFRNEKQGTFDPDRQANFIRLGMRGEFAGRDEWIDIDRIELRKIE